MRFPNAAKGVKKIFTAEILQLIAEIVAIVAIAMLIITLSAAKVNSQGGTIIAGTGTVVLFTGTAVLALIAGIMSLVGIIQASGDESSFKVALAAIIISLATAVIAGIFSTNGAIQGICQIIQNVMSLAVTVFVINGVTNLAEKLNNMEVFDKGKNLLKIIICIYAFSLVASVISLIFGGTFASVTAAILALIAALLNVLSYILYLILLNKAKKMLA